MAETEAETVRLNSNRIWREIAAASAVASVVAFVLFIRVLDLCYTGQWLLKGTALEIAVGVLSVAMIGVAFTSSSQSALRRSARWVATVVVILFVGSLLTFLAVHFLNGVGGGCN